MYNTHVRRLVSALAPSLSLDHAGACGHAVNAFHDAVFANVLRPAIAKLVGEPLLARTPRGFVHWPLTAGGLGVVDPYVELVPFVAPKPIKIPEAPEAYTPDIENKKNVWAVYYEALLEPITPREPDKSAILDGLAADFVQRKAEMKGETPSPAASELAPYWRWVLSTHGPDMLEAFGTYRFLLHELLPIHLIRSGRHPSRIASENEDMPSRAPEDDIPF
jgi:hypothetical protein